MRSDQDRATDRGIAPPFIAAPSPINPILRYGLIGFGWAMTLLGIVGAVLPVLPTVPFLLLAAWAFSKSSRRFHDWLYRHPKLGPPLKAWDRYGVIPVRGKILAVAGMWGSLAVVLLSMTGSWWLPVMHTAVIVPVSWYVLSRPSRPPKS